MINGDQLYFQFASFIQLYKKEENSDHSDSVFHMSLIQQT